MDEREPPLDGAPGALYRSLPREEPPAGLDSAVLAAARASVDPKRDRRWAAPVALAAVLVLSVGISLRVADERPDAQFKGESPSVAVVPPASPGAPAPAELSAPPFEKAEAPAAAKAETKPQPQSRPPRNRASATAVQPEPAAQSEQQAESSVRDELAKSAAPDAGRAAAPAPRAAAPAVRAEAPPAERPAARERRTEKSSMADSSLGSAAAQSPEVWLERIAHLRAEGRHREADESYVEFRRRYPAFVIAPDLLPKIAPAEMRSR